MGSKIYKGTIQMGRSTSSHDETQRVTLDIEEDKSCVLIARVAMGTGAVGNFIVGGMAECTIEMYGGAYGRLGMKRENKTMKVFVPDGEFEDRNRRAEKAVRVAEGDGWRGRVSDATNQHCYSGGGPNGGSYYNVVFARHVDDDGNPYLGE